jgi:hypothetical protein
MALPWAFLFAQSHTLNRREAGTRSRKIRETKSGQHSTLVQADGYVERADKVVHVMAMRMTDLSSMIVSDGVRSRDFH